MRKILYASPLIFILILFSLFWYKLGTDPRVLPSPLINKTVPVFSQGTLQGRVCDQNIFKHKITVLIVWASWCEYCHLEHPFLMDLSSRHEFQLVGLNYKDSKSVANSWIEEFGNPFVESVYDPEGKLALEFGVYGVPETFLIDAKGVVRYKYTGPLTKEIWEKYFVPLIGGAAA